MKKSTRTISISLLLALTLLLLSITVAFAAPPLAFHMEVHEIISGNGETFFASGPAVDAGVVCPTGVTENLVANPYGPTNGNYSFLSVEKKFVCDDGTGIFFIKMKVKLELSSGNTTAKWQFMNGGTINYTHLHGHGTLVGTPTIPGYIMDIYDGTAH